MIGEKLSPVLEEIERTLWEYEFFQEANPNALGQPNYTKEGFRAACKLFSSALMDKIWNLQESEEIEFEDRCKMAVRAGEDIRKLVKTYTDIDTVDLYK